MADIAIIAVILIIVGLSIAYIIKEKKRGVKCIGCPAGGTCGKKHDGTCGCGCSGDCE